MVHRSLNCLILCALLCAGMSVDAFAHHRCHKPRGARAEIATRDGQVFKKDGYLFGCLYSVGRKYTLGSAHRNAVWQLQGRYAAAVRYITDGSGTYAAVGVWNLGTGHLKHPFTRALGTNLPFTTVTDLELLASGSTGWIAAGAFSGSAPLNTREVHKLDGGGPSLLDSGVGVALKSLGVAEGTLYWTKTGSPFSSAVS